MVVAKESFEDFVSEADYQQSHLLVHRKLDNAILPLILLPMNIIKNDVFCYMNEEMKKLMDSTELLVSLFQRL